MWKEQVYLRQTNWLYGQAWKSAFGNAELVHLFRIQALNVIVGVPVARDVRSEVEELGQWAFRK